jgi:hypothetical protein
MALSRSTSFEVISNSELQNQINLLPEIKNQFVTLILEHYNLNTLILVLSTQLNLKPTPKPR